jgi:hypothetical protein
MALELTMSTSLISSFLAKHGDELWTLIDDFQRSYASLAPSLVEWILSKWSGLLITKLSTYVKPKKRPSTDGTIHPSSSAQQLTKTPPQTSPPSVHVAPISARSKPKKRNPKTPRSAKRKGRSVTRPTATSARTILMVFPPSQANGSPTLLSRGTFSPRVVTPYMASSKPRRKTQKKREEQRQQSKCQIRWDDLYGTSNRVRQRSAFETI